MTLVSPRFFRAHGLGNDYLVFEAVAPGASGGWPLSAAAVAEVCRRGWGEGSDGIVVLMDPQPGPDRPFPVRMFNPDGSEFERSGNGLRVLGAKLAHDGRVGRTPFRVRTGGAEVTLELHGSTPEGVRDLSVDMGQALAGASAVQAVGWKGQAPVASTGPGAAVALDPAAAGPGLAFVPVWVGNPHAVVFVDDPALDLDGELLRRLGPLLATHPDFARGTNVQLARVERSSAGEAELALAIWERGVGRTPASGTSSCAVGVAAVATERLAPGPRPLTLRMPGGTLQVRVDQGLGVVLRGPVQEVGTGELAPGFVARLSALGGAAPGG
jgi:diaminopimelate epimerase